MSNIKTINGFCDYKITDDGQVISNKFNKMKKLKITLDDKGYCRVTLRSNGHYYNFQVHRLVAIHFIPNPCNHPIVMHIDDNPLNNHHTNLRWGTIADNNKDMFNKKRNGFTPSYGKNNGRARKVMADNVVFETLTDAAKQLSCRRDTIRNRINRNEPGYKYLDA